MSPAPVSAQSQTTSSSTRTDVEVDVLDVMLYGIEQQFTESGRIRSYVNLDENKRNNA